MAKPKNADTFSSASGSSADWECDGGSQSWGSSASWSDDIESEATLQLQQKLDHVEKALYGEVSVRTLPPQLQQEVAQWRSIFPHLRICGTKAPVGPRPLEPEEGEEEVYACHGSVAEQLGNTSNSEWDSVADLQSLREQLKGLVIHKLFEKTRGEVFPLLHEKLGKKSEPPPASATRDREPLLTSRMSGRRETANTNQRSLNNVQLGSILKVSSLPRRIPCDPPSRGKSISASHPKLVLPPIEPKLDSVRSSSQQLSVLGRRTRIIQHRSKTFR